MALNSQPAAPRRIAIIGSGFSGLCLGIQLKRLGIDSFTIFEKADRLGGTWRENTYPGAACDVPSFSYCFSFEQKTDWSRKWAPQSEILEYMEDCAKKYDLLRHIRFGTEIAGANWDEAAAVWKIRTANGEEVLAEVLVAGVGQLNRPNMPKLARRRKFQRRVVSFGAMASRRRPDRQDRRRRRQCGQRDPVHPADRAQGRQSLYLPAQRELDGPAKRSRVHRRSKAPLREQSRADAALPMADLFPARDELAGVSSSFVSVAADGASRRDLHAHDGRTTRSCRRR